MSCLTTTENNNLFSCLTNMQNNIKKKKYLKTNKTETNLTNSFKDKGITNIYNKINYKKKSPLTKYDNVHIFSMREKRFENKKKKLNLRIKKNSSEIRKCDENLMPSQSSVYITQNLSEEQFVNLPTIIERIKKFNNTEMNRNINKVRYKNKILIPKKEKSTKIEISQPTQVLFLHKLKEKLDKKKEAKKRIKSEENDFFKKKVKRLNLYNKKDNYYLTYIENFHDYLKKKKVYNLRKERYIEIEQANKNKVESVKEQIHSMIKSQNLLDNEFINKIQEYLISLYKEKEKQNKKDIILCTKIYELRNEVRILDKQLQKLLNMKNTYIKWLLLQIQVRDKLLKLPEKYQELLNIDNNKKLPKELEKYIQNPIYQTPEELINKIDFYQNQNIKFLEIYHKKTLEIYPLRDELEEQEKSYRRISNEEEINKLNELKIKLKSKNEILLNKVKSLRIELNILPKKKVRRKKYSKLFEKIIEMRNNIIDNKTIENKNLNENKILLMLKEIELEFLYQKEKNKIYSLKYKDEIKIVRDKREKEKRLEKIKLNKNLIEEKKNLFQKNLEEKKNKIIIIPKIKINWNIYNIKKIDKTSINKNNRKDDTKESLYEYLFS